VQAMRPNVRRQKWRIQHTASLIPMALAKILDVVSVEGLLVLVLIKFML